MSNFFEEKPDIFFLYGNTWHVRRRNTFLRGSGRTMAFVRQQIERGGERLWKLEDFRDRPFAAVAQALSRLTRQGRLERLSKGVYYRTRDTSFGKSRPNPSAIQRLASRRKSVFPSGIAAASLLGFSTRRQSKTRLLPERSAYLENSLAAIPSSIRADPKHGPASRKAMRRCSTSCAGRPGRASSPEETIRRTVTLFSEKGRFERLLRIAASEPPRPSDDRRYRRTAREKQRGAALPAKFPESLFTIRLRPVRRTAKRP